MDSAGNRTAKVNDLSGGATTNYGYDAIYELLSATQGANTTESYTYDPVGNRLTSLAAASYSYNVSNEMTSNSNASYTYDYDGNTTSKTASGNTTNYSWDFENRLTQVTLPNSGGTVTFKYDPFGRRIEKISPATTSTFVYDGANLVQTVNSTGGLVAHYAQTMNIDEPLAMQRSGTTYYYEADGLGSVTSLSSSAGALANTYTYDSFGNVTNSTGSVTNFLEYTGREFDAETGLYFYRSRYYDSSTGRFISEDPFKEVLRGLNFYAYVRNDPVGYTDPNGKSPWDWWDKLWGWLGFGKTAWNAASSTMDWSLCGLYYVDCLNQGMGIKKEIAQALNSPDPVISGTAWATLAQQTGSNSMSQLNVNVCMHNENCQKAFQCAQKGLTSPLPFPVNIPLNH